MTKTPETFAETKRRIARLADYIEKQTHMLGDIGWFPDALVKKSDIAYLIESLYERLDSRHRDMGLGIDWGSTTRMSKESLILVYNLYLKCALPNTGVISFYKPKFVKAFSALLLVQTDCVLDPCPPDSPSEISMVKIAGLSGAIFTEASKRRVASMVAYIRDDTNLHSNGLLACFKRGDGIDSIGNKLEDELQDRGLYPSAPAIDWNSTDWPKPEVTLLVYNLYVRITDLLSDTSVSNYQQWFGQRFKDLGISDFRDTCIVDAPTPSQKQAKLDLSLSVDFKSCVRRVSALMAYLGDDTELLEVEGEATPVFDLFLTKQGLVDIAHSLREILKPYSKTVPVTAWNSHLEKTILAYNLFVYFSESLTDFMLDTYEGYFKAMFGSLGCKDYAKTCNLKVISSVQKPLEPAAPKPTPTSTRYQTVNDIVDVMLQDDSLNTRLEKLLVGFNGTPQAIMEVLKANEHKDLDGTPIKVNWHLYGWRIVHRIYKVKVEESLMVHDTLHFLYRALQHQIDADYSLTKVDDALNATTATPGNTAKSGNFPENLLTTAKPNGENTMKNINAKPVETRVFIYDVPASDVTDDRIYDYITALESEIASLECIKHKPNRLVQEQEELQAQITALVDYMNLVRYPEVKAPTPPKKVVKRRRRSPAKKSAAAATAKAKAAPKV